MAELHDKEFGTIIVRRNSSLSSMKVTAAPNGKLRVSAPQLAPIFSIKRMIASSRPELRKLLGNRPTFDLVDGMPIGKSHRLRIHIGGSFKVKRSGLEVWLTVPDEASLSDSKVVDAVRQTSIAALRKEAHHYLPKRVERLAEEHGFRYEKLRFSHASTRWGSCSTNGTISLNIALMKLPFELIDYVIIHELAHTKQMNHSQDFWLLVQNAYPGYKTARATIKKYSPAV